MLTIRDINSRIYNKNITRSPGDIIHNPPSINESENIYSKDILRLIEKWDLLDQDIDKAFNVALEYFDVILDYGNEQEITRAFNILSEGARNKVRDAAAFSRSFKARLSRRKHNATKKIKKANKNLQASINNSFSNIYNKLHKVAKTESFNREELADRFYNGIYYALCEASEIDRIITNYDNISKRFNIDKLIIENTANNKDLYQAIYEMSSCIDTYNSNFMGKYNTALEMSWYIINKNYLDCSKEYIIETVTDYFLHHGYITENSKDDISRVIECSPIFNRDNFNIVSYVFNENTKERDNSSLSIPVDESVSTYGTESISMIKNKINRNPSECIKDLVNEYKKSCMDNRGTSTNMMNFKALLDKGSTIPEFYTEELPKIFGILRAAFVLGDFSIDFKYINDALDIIYNGAKALDIDTINTVILYYNNEIQWCSEKLKTRIDEESVTRLSEYETKLQDDKSKLESLVSSVNEMADTITEYDEKYYKIKALSMASTVLDVYNKYKDPSYIVGLENLLTDYIEYYNSDIICSVTELVLNINMQYSLKAKLVDKLEHKISNMQPQIDRETISRCIYDIKSATGLSYSRVAPNRFIVDLKYLDCIKVLIEIYNIYKMDISEETKNELSSALNEDLCNSVESYIDYKNNPKKVYDTEEGLKYINDISITEDQDIFREYIVNALIKSICIDYCINAQEDIIETIGDILKFSYDKELIDFLDEYRHKYSEILLSNAQDVRNAQMLINIISDKIKDILLFAKYRYRIYIGGLN